MAPTEVTEKQLNDARLLLSSGVVQAILGDKRNSASRALVDVLERSVFNNLKQCEEWSAIFLKDLMDENKDEHQIQTLNDHMKDYLTASFRQKYVSLSSTHTFRGKPYSAHISVIRKLNQELSRNLRLEGTKLLDMLYEYDVLSESDQQSILAETTDKRKNEAFINYLCSNFTTETFTAKVLPLFSKDDIHADLAEKIKNELERASAFTGSLVCTSCKMKGLADPRKLSEALYELGAISESLKRDLCLSTQPSSTRWEDLSRQVSEEKLLEVLMKKYPHLYFDFQDTGHSVFKCCCFNLVKADVAQLSDFTSDYMNVDECSSSSSASSWEDRSVSSQRVPSTKPASSLETKAVLFQTDPSSRAVSSQEDRGISTQNITSNTSKSSQKTKAVLFQTGPSKTSDSSREDIVVLKQRVSSNKPASTQETKAVLFQTVPSSRSLSSWEDRGVSTQRVTSNSSASSQETEAELFQAGPSSKPTSSKKTQDVHSQTRPSTRSSPSQEIKHRRTNIRSLDQGHDERSTKIKIATDDQDILNDKAIRQRRIDLRKQLHALAEEHKEKTTKLRARIARYEKYYDQMEYLFLKASANQLLEDAKEELEKVEEDYIERRGNICDPSGDSRPYG